MTSRARQSGGAGAARRRPIWLYAVAAATVVVAIAAVMIAEQFLRPGMTRPPADFLPATARAVVAFDLRPSSPAVLKMRQVWSKSDVDRLEHRAIDLSQSIVDWTGLKLDVRKDVQPWFGGEMVVGTVRTDTAPAFSPRSVVLVARATSMRRARAALDRATNPTAQKMEWKRLIARRDSDTITVWRDEMHHSQVAYATRDGCIVVSPSLDVVADCLVAAQHPAERLVTSAAFTRSYERLPPDTAIWAYFDVATAARVTQQVMPALLRGWIWALRKLAYGMYGRQTNAPEHGRRERGALAVAISPNKDGVLLKGVYASTEETAASAVPNQLEQLGRLLPRDTAAYVLAHEPGRLAPTQARPSASRRSILPFMFLGPAAGLASLPDNLLVAAVASPGASPSQTAGRLATIVAAPAEEMIPPARLLFGALLKESSSATIGDFYVMATHQEALTRCRRAFADKRERLPIAHRADRELDAWAEPSRLSRTMEGVKEVGLTAWASPGGGEGEVVVKAEPRRLLGGERAVPESLGLLW